MDVKWLLALLALCIIIPELYDVIAKYFRKTADNAEPSVTIYPFNGDTLTEAKKHYNGWCDLATQSGEIIKGYLAITLCGITAEALKSFAYKLDDNRQGSLDEMLHQMFYDVWNGNCLDEYVFGRSTDKMADIIAETIKRDFVEQLTEHCPALRHLPLTVSDVEALFLDSATYEKTRECQEIGSF